VLDTFAEGVRVVEEAPAASRRRRGLGRLAKD
jgi:hypothetical protein